MAGTSSQEHSSCDVYREVIYEILRQGKKSYPVSHGGEEQSEAAEER